MHGKQLFGYIKTAYRRVCSINGCIHRKEILDQHDFIQLWTFLTFLVLIIGRLTIEWCFKWKVSSVLMEFLFTIGYMVHTIVTTTGCSTVKI